MNSVRNTIAVLLLPLAATSMALGHAGPRIYVDVENDTVVTKKSHHANFEPSQVFAGTLTELPPAGTNIWRTDFPGFEAAGGHQIPDETMFGFNILDAVKVWNGSAFVDPGTEKFNISRTLDVNTGAGFVGGFNFFTQSDVGSHAHLTYSLLGNGSALGGGDNGVYALKLELTSGGLDDSLPFYLLLSKNASSEDATAAFNYASTLVPEPTSMALIAAGGVLALSVRRRPWARHLTA